MNSTLGSVSGGERIPLWAVLVGEKLGLSHVHDRAVGLSHVHLGLGQFDCFFDLKTERITAREKSQLALKTQLNIQRISGAELNPKAM